MFELTIPYLYYQSSNKRRKSPVKRNYVSPTKIVKSIVTDHSYENPEKVELGDIVSETDQEMQELQTKSYQIEGKRKST